MYSVVGMGVAAAALAGASLVAGCGPKIGDHFVPQDLRCGEDEVIGFNLDEPGPREPECVHPDVYIRTSPDVGD